MKEKQQVQKKSKFAEVAKNRVLLGMEKLPETLWSEANEIANDEFGDDVAQTRRQVETEKERWDACGCGQCRHDYIATRERLRDEWLKPKGD